MLHPARVRPSLPPAAVALLSSANIVSNGKGHRNRKGETEGVRVRERGRKRPGNQMKLWNTLGVLYRDALKSGPQVV